MTVEMAIKLPEETFERVKSMATEVGQTPADFIITAVKEYLQDFEEVARAEAILDKIDAGEMRTYSLDEVSRRLGLDD